MTASDQFKAGNLKGAIDASTAQVKAKPGESSARGLLAELLLYAGDLQRADTQLDAMMQQNPGDALALSQVRHFIRAETARQQFYSEGRVPEFIDQPTAEMRLRLEASIALRENRMADAVAKLAEAETQRPRVSGTCDGEPFDDMRDLDDLCASFFEVLTSTGKYFWTPMSRVESVAFHEPKRPRDLLWRGARMVVRSGPDGEVAVAALYAGSHLDPSDAVKLGRSTEWAGGEDAPVRGRGQRVFLVGDRDRGIMEITQLEFAEPAGA